MSRQNEYILLTIKCIVFIYCTQTLALAFTVDPDATTEKLSKEALSEIEKYENELEKDLHPLSIQRENHDENSVTEDPQILSKVLLTVKGDQIKKENLDKQIVPFRVKREVGDIDWGHPEEKKLDDPSSEHKKNYVYNRNYDVIEPSDSPDEREEYDWNKLPDSQVAKSEVEVSNDDQSTIQATESNGIVVIATRTIGGSETKLTYDIDGEITENVLEIIDITSTVHSDSTEYTITAVNNNGETEIDTLIISSSTSTLTSYQDGTYTDPTTTQSPRPINTKTVIYENAFGTLVTTSYTIHDFLNTSDAYGYSTSKTTDSNGNIITNTITTVEVTTKGTDYSDTITSLTITGLGTVVTKTDFQGETTVVTSVTQLITSTDQNGQIVTATVVDNTNPLITSVQTVTTTDENGNTITATSTVNGQGPVLFPETITLTESNDNSESITPSSTLIRSNIETTTVTVTGEDGSTSTETQTLTTDSNGDITTLYSSEDTVFIINSGQNTQTLTSIGTTVITSNTITETETIYQSDSSLIEIDSSGSITSISSTSSSEDSTEATTTTDTNGSTITVDSSGDTITIITSVQEDTTTTETLTFQSTTIVTSTIEGSTTTITDTIYGSSTTTVEIDPSGSVVSSSSGNSNTDSSSAVNSSSSSTDQSGNTVTENQGTASENDGSGTQSPGGDDSNDSTTGTDSGNGDDTPGSQNDSSSTGANGSSGENTVTDENNNESTGSTESGDTTSQNSSENSDNTDSSNGTGSGNGETTTQNSSENGDNSDSSNGTGSGNEETTTNTSSGNGDDNTDSSNDTGSGNEETTTQSSSGNGDNIDSSNGTDSGNDNESSGSNEETTTQTSSENGDNNDLSNGTSSGNEETTTSSENDDNTDSSNGTGSGNGNESSGSNEETTTQTSSGNDDNTDSSNGTGSGNGNESSGSNGETTTQTTSGNGDNTDSSTGAGSGNGDGTSIGTSMPNGSSSTEVNSVTDESGENSSDAVSLKELLDFQGTINDYANATYIYNLEYNMTQKLEGEKKCPFNQNKIFVQKLQTEVKSQAFALLWDQNVKGMLMTDRYAKQILKLNPDSGKWVILSVSAEHIEAIIPTNSSETFILVVNNMIVSFKNGFSKDGLIVKYKKMLACFDSAVGFGVARTDSEGRLWLAVRYKKYEEEREKLYLICDGQAVEQQTSTKKIGGIAWSSDNLYVYISDLEERTIYAYEYNHTSGEIGNPQKIIDFKEHKTCRGTPYDIAVDSKGDLWVAQFGDSAVIKINGVTWKMDKIIYLPIHYPVSLAFGGTEMDKLIVSTAFEIQTLKMPFLYAIGNTGAKGKKTTNISPNKIFGSSPMKITIEGADQQPPQSVSVLPFIDCNLPSNITKFTTKTQGACAFSEDIPIVQETKLKISTMGFSAHYDKRRGSLFLTDLFEPAVIQYKEASGKEIILTFEDVTSASAVIPIKGESEQFLIAEDNRIVMLENRFRTSEILPVSFKRIIAQINEPDPNIIFGIGKTDSKGRLWIGTGTVVKKQRNACKLYVLHKRTLKEVASGFTSAGGMAWSTDKNEFFFVDSGEGVIYSYKYNEATASIQDRSVVFSVNGTTYENYTITDITVDSKNHLWVTIYGGYSVICMTKFGEIKREINIPAKFPTTLEFGGKDRTLLYVATARPGSTPCTVCNQANLYVISNLGVTAGRPETNPFVL